MVTYHPTEAYDMNNINLEVGGLTVDSVELTATVTEINAVCDSSNSSETLTATRTLTADESGKTFFLSAATEFVTTLPALQAGLKFSFICTAAPSGANYTIFTASGANIMKGQIYSVDVNSATDPDFETSGGDTFSFVSAKAVAGDRVDMVCDGTNWFAYGFCSVFDALTITTAA